MFRDIHDIYLSTDFFGKETLLNKALSRPYNMIFGHNGSGKSTLADALDILSRGEEVALHFDSSITDEEKKHIFVFNESFMRRNVEVHDNGLEAIIMLGDAGNRSREEADLKGKIKAAEEAIAKAESERENFDSDASELRDSIEENLRNGYAARGRDIRGLKRKISVNVDDFISGYANLQAGILDAVTLMQEVMQGIEQLQSLSGGSMIEWNAPEFDCLMLKDRVAELLATTIEKPELDARERSIIDLMGQYDLISQTRAIILDSDASFCPLCHQDISAGHRDRLKGVIERIEAAMSRKADNFKQALEDAKSRCSIPELDFSPLEDRFQIEQKVVNDALVRVKYGLDDVVRQIDSRLCNVFAEPSVLDSKLLDEALDSYNEALETLLQNIGLYNTAVDEKASFQKKLSDKNLCLAYLENKTEIVAYQKLALKVDEAKAVEEAESDKLAQLKHDLGLLHSQMEQSDIALEYINDCLSYIFFDKNRLRLEHQESEESGKGCYILISHGHKVMPDKVSIGERNAIGLAYYFAQTFKGRSLADRYSHPALYVIDDPVSSFDQSNRLGIMTFLKEQFFNILNGNPDSKILLLSHDLKTVDELGTMVKDIARNLHLDEDFCESLENQPYFELSEKHLIPVRKTTHNNYRRLLEAVYAYAHGSTEDLEGDDSIGNQMRRLLEAYSSFNFGCGVQDMLNNPLVLSSVPTEHREFYRRLAAMLVLNTESHADVRIDPLNGFADTYAPSDMKKLAREILAFIWFTGPIHLQCLLTPDACDEIKEWAEQLPVDRIAGAMEQARVSEIEAKCAKYQGQVFQIQKDADQYVHCEECIIPQTNWAKDHVLSKVRLTKVTENISTWSRRKYPVFSKYEPVDD